jgi:hypothetical protein
VMVWKLCLRECMWQWQAGWWWFMQTPNLHDSQNIRPSDCLNHVTRMRETKHAHKILIGEEEKRSFGRSRMWWEDNTGTLFYAISIVWPFLPRGYLTHTHTHTQVHSPSNFHSVYRSVNHLLVAIHISCNTYAEYRCCRKCRVNSDNFQICFILGSKRPRREDLHAAAM